MKKALVVLMALAFVLAISTVAFAQVTYNPDGTHTYSPNGDSAWQYKDLKDSGFKPEGSYRAYDSTGTLTGINDTVKVYEMTDIAGTHSNEAERGPHGDYITTSNKCKTCHAVHRADGVFYLLRADNPDSACDFCHVGANIHSNRAAYYRSTEGKYTSNGHTIGSGPEIPDSSVWQTNGTRTITSADGLQTLTVQNVREYDPNENKIFKIGGHGGRVRTGPYLLQCQTCHSVHNADKLIWKPGQGDGGADAAYTSLVGYMLLRNAPSGSVDSETAMKTYKSGLKIDAIHGAGPDVGLITAPESTITASNTGIQPDGSHKTIWTTWTGPDTGVNDGYRLAVWCADCHNLNIGYPNKSVGTTFGDRSHVARTHPVPYMQAGLGGNNGAGCESCHVTDMQPNAGNCGARCHIAPSGYKVERGLSDYPHSGNEGSTKLLGDTMLDPGGAPSPSFMGGRYVAASGTATDTPWDYGMDEYGNHYTTEYDKSVEHIDAVCQRCHAEDVGVTE